MRLLTVCALALAIGCASKVSPPVATIAAVSAAHVGIALQLDGTKSVSLRPGQQLSYSWSFLALPPRSQAKLNDAHLAGPSFTPDIGGTYALRMVVDDGLMSASADLSVAAADDCRPVISGMQQSPERPDVGQTAAITATATASCGEGASIAQINWAIIAAPAGSKAQILLATTARPSFAPDVRGDYDLLVTATDTRGLQSLDSDAAHLRYSTLPCGDNSPVVTSITSAPASPDVGTQVQLTPSVHDDDKDSCAGLARSYAYAWHLTKLPSGSRAQLNNAAVEKPSFTPDVNGTYTASLVVTDNLGRASAAVSQDVVTTHCGDAIPTAAANGPASAVPTGTAIQLHTIVHDADNPAYDGTDSAGGPATTPASGCGLALSYTYQWQMLSAPAGSTARLNNTTLANPTFTADVSGAYTAQVIALASTGHASAPSIVTVTAAPCGSVPISSSISAPAAVITSAPVQLSAGVTDTNSSCSLTTQPYSYAWSIVSAPAGSAAQLNSAASAMPSFTPDKGGDYVVRLKVTDQLGLSAFAPDQTVHANDCNQPLPAPAILVNGNAADDVTITGSPTLLSATIVDNNAPPATPAPGTCAAAVAPFSYRWSLVGLPQGSRAALNDAASATPSFTADVAGGDAYTVQLVVTDAAGNASAPASVDIDAADCTHALAAPAIATAGSAPFSTGVPVALSVSNLAALDPNDPAITGTTCTAAVSPLSFHWTLVAQPSNSHAVLNNANAANPSFVPDVGGAGAAGTYTVRLVVNDAAGNASPPTQFSVTSVGSCNQPPVITPPPSLLAAAGQAYTLSATVTDPNDPASNSACPALSAVPLYPLTYAWQMVAQPSGSRAALNNPNAAAPSFVPDVASTTQKYSFVLTATDAQGNRGVSQRIDVSALPAAACNQPLTVPSPAFTTSGTLKVGVYNGSQITVTSAITDPNPSSCFTSAAALSWTWSMLARPPGSAASIVDPTAPSAKFSADVAGTYVFSGRAADQLGNSANVQASVQVSGCASVPAVTVNATPAGPEIGQRVTLAAQVADANGCGAPSVAPFSYAWQLSPAAGSARAVLSSQSGASTSFVPDVAGSYSYSLLVTDSVGAQGSVGPVAVSAMDCTFTAANFAVTGAGSGTTFSTRTLSAGALTGLPAGCTATPALGYAWTFDQVAAGSTAQFNAPADASTAFTLDVPNGTWIARVTITDLLSGLTATKTATVTSTSCGASGSLVAGIGVVNAAGTTVIAAANHGSYPAASNGTVGTHPVSVQLDGLSFLPATPPNSACGGSAYAFKWTLLQLPPGSAAAINPTTAALPTITLDQLGDYVFQLVANDGIVASAPTYLRVHAN